GSRTAGGFRRRRAASAGCAPTGPLTVRIGRDSCEADASGCEFDEEQDVEPLQEERVDGEEVALEDARRLRPQEPRPALLDPDRVSATPWGAETGSSRCSGDFVFVNEAAE